MNRTTAQLRAEFDGSFARALQADRAAAEDFLSIRLGTDVHVLRLSEVASLGPLAALTRFPGPLPELLGITGLRGNMIPVYDLRRLLGYAGTDTPRWQVVAADWPVALAFDAFDGQLRVPRDQGARAAGSEHTRRHVLEVLDAGAGVRPVVSLPSVVQAIHAVARQAGAH